MTTYVVKPADLGKFERRLTGQLRIRAASALRDVRKPVLALLRQKSEGIRDQGQFQNGWRAAVRFLAIEFWNEAKHSIFVEGTDETHPFSRRPGKKMPPLQVIREWLERRGSDPRLAFVVARAIAARGILARPVLRAPDVRSTIADMIQATIVRARDEAVRASL